MPNFPKKLLKKLVAREQQNALRRLSLKKDLIDFSSNDYLGFSRLTSIQETTDQQLKNFSYANGAAGSRLLSGNHEIHEYLESYLVKYFEQEAALLFNSGYDANIGFFSSVPQRGDVILYDELVHASIRDGIKMGNAKSYKFKHNNLSDLNSKIQAVLMDSIPNETDIYVVTESVFSMDGDSPNLKKMVELCSKNKCLLVVDEAHALGVYRKGLLQDLNLHNKVFAQIITFGKAMGSHGAAILGNQQVKSYLINFARSFIYTTALSPHSVASTLAAFYYLESEHGKQKQLALRKNIEDYKCLVREFGLQDIFLSSDSAIQIALVSGNSMARNMANSLSENGFDVRAILSPTVPSGNERLRICLHSFNSKEELQGLVSLLKELHG
ncbi:aminotransferase class I/II-fold pyridoxal phosphate-dependent enzyme [uncultured Croceitalea sp.]|uniref:aminotransferase class I/II-fold pyridoxal phosphate-dependent enzyme n=1 Tax=uncultured Croceitalea sp. TaxID=1798908 RepID=UPI0033063300